jgi:hypothetical protein
LQHLLFFVQITIQVAPLKILKMIIGTIHVAGGVIASLPP